MWHRDRVRKQLTQRPRPAESGLTLLELIITCAILLVLSTAALPVAKYTLIRQKETQLRHDLLMLREAIDRYKDAADHNQIKVEIGSEGYPPDLETLTKEIQLGSGGDKKIRFLRTIPVDTMTGQTDWGLRAVGDDPDSQSWGGKNVFDVYSKSTGTAMNGTKYADW
jgi:general secretion pathway protein G